MHLVVEIVDGCPFDLLPNILVLFSLECELNEDLLQLLIDVVDAQLLEAVGLSRDVLEHITLEVRIEEIRQRSGSRVLAMVCGVHGCLTSNPKISKRIRK